jgi:hypothetical protein
MKTARTAPAKILATLAATLVFATAAHAAFSGINPTPLTNANIRFGDAASFNGPFNGGTYNSPVANPWNGALNSLPYTLDGATGDDAQGDIFATFTATTYDLVVPLAMVQQAIGNTGSAILQFNAVVEFQTDAFGFPVNPTLFPTFFINGTVQPGGFADFTGSITYTSVANGLVDTVNYTYNNVTPGAFSATVNGVAGSGTTPAMPAFDTLTLVANFAFTVDPASISATTVPEPSSAVLTLLSLPFLLRRRRR